MRKGQKETGTAPPAERAREIRMAASNRMTDYAIRGLASEVRAHQDRAMNSSLACIMILVTLGGVLVRAEDPAKTGVEQEYSRFIAKLTKPESLIDFAEKADRLIDAGEKGQEGPGVGKNAVNTDTISGLHLEFAVIRTPEVILYYASLSRNGEFLRYSDAATMLAFFCDRIGLPHPVDVKEGEKPVFHAQWLLKPSEWKVMRKKMLEIRSQARAEKDIGKALRAAVDAEVASRIASKSIK